MDLQMLDHTIQISLINLIHAWIPIEMVSIQVKHLVKVKQELMAQILLEEVISVKPVALVELHTEVLAVQIKPLAHIHPTSPTSLILESIQILTDHALPQVETQDGTKFCNQK